MHWTDSIPLLVAFLGAMSGAFFAIVKTRKERLWLDRYETLVSLLESLEVMQTKASYDQADEIGITVTTGDEMGPIWREYKWYEGRPWWQWLVGFASVLGAIVGVLELLA